jgi:hypothetical protein
MQPSALIRHGVAAAAAILFALPSRAAFDEDVRQALQAALKDASASLRAAAIPAGEPVSALPLAGDQDGYVEALLKSAVTDAGKTFVEGKTDPFWDEIMKEVEWGMRKGDMLDAKTIVAFGKLKAARILIYGTVREAGVANRRVFVELELHASSLATKQHLWGGVFAKRFYLPGADAPEGLLDIPAQVREPLRVDIARKAVASLQKQEGKLGVVRTVAFVPLAGDIDKYATFVLRDAVSQTKLNPKNLDLQTLGEARLLLRDQPQQADALLYGALRSISRRQTGYTVRTRSYEVQAEVQACIENAATREVLWSDTLAATTTYTEETRTQWQVWSESVWPFFRNNPVITGILVVGVIIVVLVLVSRRRPR